MRLPPKLLSTSFPSVQTSDEATAAQIQLLAALFGAKAMKREWWQLLPNKKAMQLLIFVRSDPSVEFPVCRISFFFRIQSRKDFKTMNAVNLENLRLLGVSWARATRCDMLGKLVASLLHQA